MATDSATTDSPRFDRYNHLADEYRSCVVRCQQAVDQLDACEREYRQAVIDIAGQEAIVPRTWQSKIDGALSQLSQREFEVLTLVGQGLATPQVAERLSIATSTVETYRERLKSKLNLESGPALVRYAVLWSAGHRE